MDNAIHGLGSAYGKIIRKVLNFRYAMIVLFLVGLGCHRLHVSARVPPDLCRRKTRTTSSWWCRRRRALRSPTPRNVAKQAEQILRADPDVFGTFAVPGFSLSGGSSSNYGLDLRSAQTD